MQGGHEVSNANGWASCPLIHVHRLSNTKPLVGLGSSHSSICLEGVRVDPLHQRVCIYIYMLTIYELKMFIKM